MVLQRRRCHTRASLFLVNTSLAKLMVLVFGDSSQISQRVGCKGRSSFVTLIFHMSHAGLKCPHRKIALRFQHAISSCHLKSQSASEWQQNRLYIYVGKDGGNRNWNHNEPNRRDFKSLAGGMNISPAIWSSKALGSPSYSQEEPVGRAFNALSQGVGWADCLTPKDFTGL